MLRSEDVHAECGLVGKVHAVGAGGDIVVSEEGATGKVEVGEEAALVFAIPLQDERIEAYAVGSIGGLEDEEDGDGVDGILEASAKKSRQMPAGEDPSVAEARVKDAGVASSAADGVAAGGPDLNLLTPFFRAGLGEGKG